MHIPGDVISHRIGDKQLKLVPRFCSGEHLVCSLADFHMFGVLEKINAECNSKEKKN
jgi:hypothetical protein